MKRIASLVVVLGVLALACSLTSAQEQQPPAPGPGAAGGQPNVGLDLIPRPPDGQAAPAPATKPAQVSAEASALIAKMADAYKQLKSLELAGQIIGEMNIDGQKKDDKTEFTSSFSAPNLFRHDVKSDKLLGSTGEKLYVYDNENKLYLTADAPPGKFLTNDLPGQFADLLVGQNPSLVFALSSDPLAELSSAFGVVNKKSDEKIDGKSYAVLELKEPRSGPAATLLIDPQTNLLKRVVFDFADYARGQGANDVKKAQVTVDYSKTTPNAATQPTQFAWAPPPGAKDAAKSEDGGGGEEPAMALVGKPAPAFKLTSLEGKEVSLADLKGSVVVLDFWATWCGPCVGSLPHLDKLYQDKSKAGVKVFAVNLREDKDLVGGFMKSKGLSVPVLLDTEGKAGDLYKANAIPETVIIGKDGVVKKVFVGAGPDSEKEIRDAVESAMKSTR